MPILASELVKKLNAHIEKYGDDKVMIFDGYACSYKTFNEHQISKNMNRFVIECETEED